MTRTSILLAVAVAGAGCKSGPSAAGPTAAAPQVQQAAPQTTQAAAAPAAKAPVPVATVEGVSEYQLENGLRVLLYPDESRPKFTLNVTYLVGSRHEGYGESGMAHLLEHMLFKGTPKHPDFDKELQPRGSRHNASTSYDRTNYFESMPASDENLELAIELEADRMLNAELSPDDLAKEFSVVRNEFEIRENDPGNVLRERLMSTAYLWHNYGKSTIGSRADIERVPIEALRAFYRKYYQPDNAVVILTGKFEKEKALGMIQKHFGPLPRPQRELTPTYTVEPVQDGERAVFLRRTGDVQVVGIMWHTVAGSDERSVALDAVGFLLSDKPTGRLYKALVEKGLATSVGAGGWGLHDPSLFAVIAEVPAGKSTDVVRDKIIQIVEGLGKNKPTDAEVARYRANVAKNFELAMTNSDVISRGLSEATALGDWRLFFLERDRNEKVTAGAAADVAATFFKPSNRTVGVFTPTKEPQRAPLTEAPNVVAMVKGYTGRSAGDEGEAFEATIANIEKRTTRKQLPGGIKAAFLPKETKGNVVLLQLALHFGTEKDLVGHEEAASFTAALLMRGSKKHTFEQIKSELDRLKAQVSIASGEGEATVTIRTVRESLPETLALVTEILRQPAFPKAELETMRKETLTNLEEQLSDPVAQAALVAERKLHPWPKGDIRYVPTTQESIERVRKMTLDEIKRIHAMWGVTHSELAVVGDFDPAEIEAAVVKGLGDWKTTKPYARITLPFKEVAPATETVNTPDKENAFVMVARPTAMRDDHPDYPALYMASFVLGNGFQSRLVDRLRTKEGWSYGTTAAFRADSEDERALFRAYAFVAPQNAAKVQAAMIEEIDRLVKAGVPAEELTRAKAAYQGQFANGLANDESVRALLIDGLYLDRTLEWNAKFNAAIDKLTPEAVSAALAKGAFDTATMIKVTGGDMSKATAAK